MPKTTERRKWLVQTANVLVKMDDRLLLPDPTPAFNPAEFKQPKPRKRVVNIPSLVIKSLRKKIAKKNKMIAELQEQLELKQTNLSIANRRLAHNRWRSNRKNEVIDLIGESIDGWKARC